MEKQKKSIKQKSFQKRQKLKQEQDKERIVVNKIMLMGRFQIIMQKQSPQKNKPDKSKQKIIISPNQSADQQKFNKYAYLTASLLRDLIEDDFDEQNQETEFDSNILKTIDLKTYIQSIHKQTNFEPECLIIALIYIDRYNLNNDEFTLTWTNIHKLLLACLLLATKFHDEVYYDNKAFEIGGGVNNVKLIELETKVFETLQFNLFVEEDYYFQFLESLYNGYLSQNSNNDDSLNQQTSDQEK